MISLIWHLSFSLFLLTVDATIYVNFDFVFFLCGDCLHTQMGVTLNGCLAVINFLYLRDLLFNLLCIKDNGIDPFFFTETWLSALGDKTKCWISTK